MDTGWIAGISPDDGQVSADSQELQPPFRHRVRGKTAAQEPKKPKRRTRETAAETVDAKPLPAKKTGRAAHEPVTKNTPHEVFEYVIEQGRKDYQVQRYKGLGEMTSTQLWETTMDPDRRTLLSVKLEDLAETDRSSPR